MVDRKELEALIDKARAMGGVVDVERDPMDAFFPLTITVSGIKGIGPHPMSPISLAERMREVAS